MCLAVILATLYVILDHVPGCFTVHGAALSCFIAGGILFVVAFYTSEEEHYACTSQGGRNLFLTMHTVWKQLYQEEKITKVGEQ